MSNLALLFGAGFWKYFPHYKCQMMVFDRKNYALFFDIFKTNTNQIQDKFVIEIEKLSITAWKIENRQ